jgi:phage protein D
MSSADAVRHVPDCKLTVAGADLKPADRAALTRAIIDLDVDLFAECTLVFNDPDLRLINGNLFEAGKSVKVALGFGPKKTQVFEGEVVTLEPQFRRDLPSSLRVICYDRLHRLGLSQTTRTFNNADTRDVTTRIAQEHGLSADAPQGTREHTLQNNVSDAAFLRRIAQRAGNHVRVVGTKLVVGPPPSPGKITIRPGAGLKGLRVKLRTEKNIGDVSVHGWDAQNKREIVGTARHQPADSRIPKGAGTLSLRGHEVTPPDVATAEAIARGRVLKISEGTVTVQGSMIGNPDAVPGAVLSLEDISPGVDGTYRVEHATHEFSKHGYLVRFRGVRTGSKPVPAPAKQPAQGPGQKPPKRHWLQIELVDEQGAPVPGAAYVVKTASGEELLGTLDESGKARLGGLDPGSCVVKFPGHNDSWKPA